MVADSFAEAEADTRAYWRAATPAERLNALEKLRKPFYGKDPIGGRLPRFLEVVPAECLLRQGYEGHGNSVLSSSADMRCGLKFCLCSRLLARA